jgi:hypothetical protein
LLIADVSEDVFKVGSSSPAAVLLDAVDHLERNSAKADEDIRLIRPQLTEAVDGCIAAAGFEWDHYWQKQLLKVITQSMRLTGRLLVSEKRFWSYIIAINSSICVERYGF